ncbi:endopeptidase La [Geopsychrobacter electrodiphilus]|uniref:endopeptidase La n=1 Tax=Geopsychrobacter electrodiphilus TaxID=225196 RepID=UPI00035C413E|nr:endopeptidase La [Geopsychrobacter electrodiphilus]
MSHESQSYSLSILPLKHLVIFPSFAIPMTIQRIESVRAIDAALSSGNRRIAVFSQKPSEVLVPQPEDLYTVGTAATVQLIARSGNTLQVIIQGTERITFVHFTQTDPFLKAQVQPYPLVITQNIEREALRREVMDLTSRFLALSHPEMQLNFPPLVSAEEDIMQLIYPVGKLLNLELAKEQALLAAASDSEAIRLLNDFLHHEIEILEVRKKISEQAEGKLNQEHRKYILREQIKALQQELGEGSPEAETKGLRKKFEACELPETVKPEVEKELLRLEQVPPTSPEYQVALAHLELILELPWQALTTDNLDLGNARQVLDQDHYNLKEIKERIIEQLAVMKLNPRARAPILCFVGPPGVGKTSLGQSIAKALGRKFDRFSLGGMHDEAELRGHRRTYIGAMPGRILQSIRRAGVKNPLLMLDEIDKLGRDFRGDPGAALMEILDPAQNDSFHDNYLDLPFDLSKVFFITTANSTDSIPKPLLDRMETLHLSGYSDEEKLEIARRYLFPRQRSEAGLGADQFAVPDETLTAIIRRYTREAGVRELERMLGRLARKVAVRFAEGESTAVSIALADLRELLGTERVYLEQLRKQHSPGVATGLAWTESGGDVLYIEAVILPAGEKFTLTGHLGEVMKESAMAANSYVIAHCHEFGIDGRFNPVHLHVPSGAIPKDGPSAGVTMATALTSLYLGEPVRADTAMTGEITLSGLVLPVGGVKEKILAARRSGITRVILPRENDKDLHSLPEQVCAEMELIFADRIEDVLRAAIPAFKDLDPPLQSA